MQPGPLQVWPPVVTAVQDLGQGLSGGVCPTGEGESSVRAGTRWWVWTRAVRAKAARTEGLLGVTVICSGFRSMAGVYVLIGVVSGAAG